ncbi:Outer membrane porin protein BP0840 precursor [Oligella ureolytica]|uniref:porin n=1 Tax=Oligella ureolytica TaxID=90244 RepID=UPI000DF93E9C|nr:porin [Oligella ureolytica]SUA52504.1 Outer membrane porin protein BP0840 precursor [Oligella ureolytica]
MKKTLLAAALVTGFAGVAHAESSVTLYGIVDAGYGYQQSEAKFKGGTAAQNGKITTKDIGGHSGIQNGSRWGLKGSEDLGNGTSAIFVLESGFDVMNGRSGQDNRLFGRQAYVGLTGDSWGTFTIGRQYNAGDAFVAPIDPFGTGWGFAGAENVFGGSVSDRYDSVIKYVTPNFAGFQAGLGLVYSDKDVETKGFNQPTKKVENTQTGVTFGLGYTAGALYVGGSFDYLRIEDARTVGGNKNKVDRKTKAWNIGGTYDFDVVKLHLLYGGQKDGSISNPALAAYGVGAAYDADKNLPAGAVNYGNGFFGDGYTQHSWLVGLSAPVGDAGKVMFSYAGSVADNDKVTINGVAGELEAKTHNFALGYRHALSKRTSVYGVASYGWSDLDNNRTSHEVETKRTQAIIGLQHRF